MESDALRGRRRALGYTQVEFGKLLGLSADYIGQLENGRAPISPTIARAARTIAHKPRGQSAATSDPMERIIEDALIFAGVNFQTDHGGGTEHRLDFHLPDYDIAIEVKQMHTPRVAAQMARAPDVIVAQGRGAVNFLAALIRTGDFVEMLEAPTSKSA